MQSGKALSFGEVLREHRRKAGLTQEELAERAGLSSRTVSDLERGLSLRPHRDTVRLLTQALHLTAEQEAVVLAAIRAVSRAPSACFGLLSLPPLPVPLTTLIGREREVAAVRERLLEPGTRLLTLTGAGGTGKTRLALEVAHGVGAAFPDGIVFVDLAPLADPALVLPTVAQTLGVTEAGRQPLRETLSNALQDRQLLLVLDNFEQVLDAAPVVTELLMDCAEMRVLVTSRARLRLQGERLYDVPPLLLPALTPLPPVERLTQYEAVRLFIARAQDLQPGFAVTNESASSIAEICVQLDGLPLAIELAATRARLFPPQALRARLTSRLDLLAGGARDLPARQQTLRAAISWSYSLLREVEQTLLSRLSVFVGGCSFEAAEAVCDPEGDLDLLEGTSSLVEWSLLRKAAEEESRLTMLETIREYAAEKLVESGQAAPVRRRHAEYFSALVRETMPDWLEAGLDAWLDRLETDYDNLRAALRWLLDVGEGEQALQLTRDLYPLWNTRCHYAEGQRWLEEGLERAVHAPVELRAAGLGQACVLATMRGEYGRAEALGKEGLRLRRADGDDRSIVRSLLSLALCATQRLDYSTARTLLEESLARSRAAEYTRGICISLHNLGEVALNEGNFEQAVAVTEESLEGIRAEGETRYLTYGLDILARALLYRGELQRAASLWAEGLGLAWPRGDKRAVAYHLEGFAAMAATQGNVERAGRLAGAAHAVRQEIHSPLSPPEAAILDHFLSSSRDIYDSVIWNRAWDEGRSITLEQAVAYALDSYDDR